MKGPTRPRGWEDKALARFLKEHEDEFAAERRCIVLHNSTEEARLTEVLIEGLWPGVVQAMAQSGFTTSVGPGETAVEAVRTENGRHTRRELTVMIADRNRPIMSPWHDPPSWYSRITLSVDGYGYRTEETAILTFRHDMSRAKLDRLLREPYLQGNPPELSWSSGRHGEPGEHVLKLSGGKGWSWEPAEWVTAEAEGRGRPPSNDPLANRIPHWDARLELFARQEMKDRVSRHLVLIESMENLEGDWKSTARFNRLRKAILETYEAW